MTPLLAGLVLSLTANVALIGVAHWLLDRLRCVRRQRDLCYAKLHHPPELVGGEA